MQSISIGIGKSELGMLSVFTCEKTQMCVFSNSKVPATTDVDFHTDALLLFGVLVTWKPVTVAENGPVWTTKIYTRLL